MSADSKSNERIVWVDVCKGICIFLVVYGHISGGLGAAGSVEHKSFWMTLRQWIYLFHMPAFFALSGFFAPKLSKLSAGNFLLGRLRTICFPYVVWTVIIVASQFAMVRFVNNPPDIHRAIYFLVEPYGYGLWFLYALFIISVLYYVLIRWITSGLVLASVAVLLSFLASRNIFGFWPILNASLENFIFFVLGASAMEKMFAILAKPTPSKMAFCGVALLSGMTLLFLAGWCGTWLTSLVAAILGIGGITFLSHGLDRMPLGIFWAFIGSYSLEIYLGHPLWGTLSRVVLLHANIRSETFLILGGVILSIAGSLMVGYLCRAFNFPYLFKWPANKRSAV